MVVFKGNKRIFDKILPEDSGSTGALRKITVYGVTNYTDIENVPIQINSSLLGIAQTSVNVNNLGAIRLKTLDSVGTLVDVENNWVVPNQVYTIVYKSGIFQLVIQKDNIEQREMYTVPDIDGLIALTSSSTQLEIEDVFNSDTSSFIDNISNRVLLIAKDTTGLIYINYIVNYTSNNISGIILEFIYNGYYYKHTYTVDSSNNIITSVNVIKVSLINEPEPTIQDHYEINYD